MPKPTENAYARSSRLLAKLNTELVDPADPGEFVLIDNGRDVQLRFADSVVYTSSNQDILKFLEGDQLYRLLAVASQRS